MNKILLKIVLSVFSLIIFQACGDDDSTPAIPTDSYITADYEYPSRFADNESSVSYTGQVVRNVIIKDLKTLASGNTSTAAEFEDLFSIGGASTAPMLNPQLQDDWSDFGSTKKLSDKIATDNLLGWDITPTAAMNSWFNSVSTTTAVTDGSSTRYVDENNLELNQMIGKGLLGVVAYYQAINYLAKMEDDYATNNQPDGTGASYSTMEHHWDESFGYFGAAKTYNSYANDDARKGSQDINGDGSIDYLTEYNFDWATYAAKRDIACATCSSDSDFTGSIMGAYIEGRTLIHNQGALSDITAQRTIIANNWDKLIAANIIHYANAVIADIDGGDNIVHAWAEMRAFSMALQYNEYMLITGTDLSDVITLLGNNPPAEANYDTYKISLTSAVAKLKTAYMFEDVNVTVW
jgi:hypothetical protein|tara:strand:- start:1595 stop:2818 length:1224 start_codon:yes stop_codon:yes gene_type:complete